MLNEGLINGHVYSPTIMQQLAFWPVLYHSFKENFPQEVFRQIRFYLPQLFRQITSSKSENGPEAVFILP